MPSGRSAGVNAVRCTDRALPVSLVLTTETCSETEAGVVPVAALPKLTLECSSAMEMTGWMSMSTVALAETPLFGGGGGGPAPHEEAGDAEFLGAADPLAKSPALLSASVQPP